MPKCETFSLCISLFLSLSPSVSDFPDGKHPFIYSCRCQDCWSTCSTKKRVFIMILLHRLFFKMVTAFLLILYYMHLYVNECSYILYYDDLCISFFGLFLKDVICQRWGIFAAFSFSTVLSYKCAKRSPALVPSPRAIFSSNKKTHTNQPWGYKTQKKTQISMLHRCYIP